MTFEVTPDGQGAISGLMADLTADQLKAMAGSAVRELPRRHGLHALFLHSGQRFQVFYVSPDGERLVSGVMFDALGRDITREQIDSIPGTIPTVTIGEETRPGAKSAGTIPALSDSSLLAVAEHTTHGVAGAATAPQLWMFIDPQCSYSIKAMQEVAPYVAQGRVRLNVIPLSILDREDDGLSTQRALDLVSTPADEMVSRWEDGQVSGPATPDAPALLRGNMQAAAAAQLRGTPLFLWSKPDGSLGRVDGVPSNVGAMIASLGS